MSISSFYSPLGVLPLGVCQSSASCQHGAQPPTERRVRLGVLGVVEAPPRALQLFDAANNTVRAAIWHIRLSLARGVAVLCGFRTRDPWDGSRRRYRKATPKPQSDLILVLNLSLILSSINILLNILTLARHTSKQKIKFYLKSTKMPMIPPIFRVNHNYIRAQIFITRNNIVSY